MLFSILTWLSFYMNGLQDEDQANQREDPTTEDTTKRDGVSRRNRNLTSKNVVDQSTSTISIGSLNEMESDRKSIAIQTETDSEYESELEDPEQDPEYHLWNMELTKDQWDELEWEELFN